MSLSALQTSSAANEGRVMLVLHPSTRVPLKDAAGSEVWIRLRGKDSDAFIEAERKARERNIENLQNRVKFSAAEADRISAETMAACTVEWSGVPTGWVERSDDDAPIAFSPGAALKLYENPGVDWLFEQADKFVADRANFLKA